VIDKVTGGIRPIDTIDGAAIGIMAICSELNADDMRLLRTPADVTAADDGTGTLTAIMDAIRMHSSAPVVVVAYEEATDPEDPDIVSSASTYTGVYRFLKAEAELGVRPRLLAQALAPNIEDDLVAAATRLLATAYIDGPNTNDAAAISGVGDLSSERAQYCDPAFVNSTSKVIGSSVLWAAIASTLNFWESASNKTVLGIDHLSRSIGFTMGDASSQAQTLNDAKVNTIIRKSGYRLWGGLSTATDPMFKFLSVARTDDVIAESIQEAFLWAVDMGITKTFVEDVVDSVNAFLRDLTARGAIIGGSAWVNKELNSATSLAAGNLFVDYDFTPIYPAYSITMRRHLTNSYLATIFG
jgi:hypothetical protein